MRPLPDSDFEVHLSAPAAPRHHLWVATTSELVA